MYVEIPEGYDIEHEISLLGSIYGLKHSVHILYTAFIKVLVKELGFLLSVIDPCLLMHIDDRGTVIVMVIDSSVDVIIVSSVFTTIF